MHHSVQTTELGPGGPKGRFHVVGVANVGRNDEYRSAARPALFRDGLQWFAAARTDG
jgi:hypothetical protein